MAKRSLQASPTGIREAKKAFTSKGWTQEGLALEINLKTRQPVWRFFTGQPVDRYTFMEICNRLELDWRLIAENPPAELLELGDRIDKANLINLDGLVQEIRAQRGDKIEGQCGTIHLLDISRRVSMEDIYIDVNILEGISSQKWLDITQLKNVTSEQFERFGLGDIDQKQISGMQAVTKYSKLRVLGKPGSGKTTFLQHLAIQCNRGSFLVNRVPIFITLRDFVDESSKEGEFSLLKYIKEEFITSGIKDATNLETLLLEGRILLLLDGVDEVLKRDNNAVVREIRRFSEKYQRNIFIVACRTASKAYNFKNFMDVEIAPFTTEQINTFAQKWFTEITKSNIQDGQEKANHFVQQLDLPKNLQFRRLVITPLFLHLACWIFDHKETFPTQGSEFYKQCLDLLLVKWDQVRGIQRDQDKIIVLLPQKLKLLSQIAAATFEEGDYFFKQQTIEQYIAEYISSLPNASIQPEELQSDSEKIFKAIELQHGIFAERVQGIFSFSYLAFQEYFTARKIVASHNLQGLNRALEGLVVHITEPRWREIFLLTSTMLKSADFLMQLMKQEIDSLVAEDPYLQEFLTWTSQKSLNIPVPPNLPATRAFYFGLIKNPHLASQFALACTLDQGILLDMALDDLILECAINKTSFAHTHVCGEALSNALTIVLDIGLKQSLEHLQDELPAASQNQKQVQDWWTDNHLAWIERLRSAIAQYRNIQHSWDFTPEQEQVLQSYYEANQLLLNCLNSHSEVTKPVREEIEAALLLPQKELEEREWQ